MIALNFVLKLVTRSLTHLRARSYDEMYLQVQR